MPTPAAIATAEWFYEIRHKSTQFPADVAENAKAERDYLLNLWAEEIDKRFAAFRLPDGKDVLGFTAEQWREVEENEKAQGTRHPGPCDGTY